MLSNALHDCGRGQHLSEVHGEAIGVIQLKCVLAAEGTTARVGGRFLEALYALLQRPAEARLLLPARTTQILSITKQISSRSISATTCRSAGLAWLAGRHKHEGYCAGLIFVAKLTQRHTRSREMVGGKRTLLDESHKGYKLLFPAITLCSPRRLLEKGECAHTG